MLDVGHFTNELFENNWRLGVNKGDAWMIISANTSAVIIIQNCKIGLLVPSIDSFLFVYLFNYCLFSTPAYVTGTVFQVQLLMQLGQ